MSNENDNEIDNDDLPPLVPVPGVDGTRPVRDLKIAIDGTVGYHFGMSYFQQHAFTTVHATLPEYFKSDHWQLTVRWQQLSGRYVTLHNEIIRPSGDVVQLDHRVTKATVQGWFNRSIGEGTQAIPWDVQIDAVIGGEAYSDIVRFTVSLF
ncbi:hypothetical protein [Pseudomonas sp. MWU16-30317]|uniref:hypothetical protein n=1 Tax=Pseudomonas sp. MWU16-30317 TaxID=2878095 RepID=UPI001CFB9AC5|nr:hypothetical protein [Pseudomonas sp. MWU16-30317]